MVTCIKCDTPEWLFYGDACPLCFTKEELPSIELTELKDKPSLLRAMLYFLADAYRYRNYTDMYDIHLKHYNYVLSRTSAGILHVVHKRPNILIESFIEILNI